MTDYITKSELAEFEKGHNQTLKEFRDLIEKNSDNLSAEDQEKIDRIDKDWEKYEDFAQKYAADLRKREELEKTVESLSDELQEKAETLVALEKKVFRGSHGAPLSGTKDADEAWTEMKHFMLTGDISMKGVDYKYLRTDNNEDGGFLVPPAPLQPILAKITELSAMREICTVMTTAYNEVPFPIRLLNGSAFWVGEGETVGTSNPTYGLEKIFLHEMARNVQITNLELQDSAFNMESEISTVVGLSFAKTEGAFIDGDGVKKPEGFLNNPYIQVVNSGNANSFDGDAIINLDAELKTDYRNPIRILTRKTLAHIRTLKSQDQYLLAALRDGLPPTINGSPYKEMPDMPEIAADAKPMAFGDFRRGIVIVDKPVMTMIRDPFSNKLKGLIDFLFRKRVGGMTIMPEAIKVLKCSM